jgi:hypothetical protein
MRAIPTPMRETFTAKQLEALAQALEPRTDRAVRDYRVSVRAFRANFFVRLIVGPERRNRARLEAEGQLGFGRTLVAIALGVWFVISLVLIALATLLYAYKTHVGIDLFPGNVTGFLCGL